jgi:hypothetical protein
MFFLGLEWMQHRCLPVPALLYVFPVQTPPSYQGMCRAGTATRTEGTRDMAKRAYFRMKDIL